MNRIVIVISYMNEIGVPDSHAAKQISFLSKQMESIRDQERKQWSPEYLLQCHVHLLHGFLTSDKLSTKSFAKKHWIQMNAPDMEVCFEQYNVTVINQ